MNIKPNPIVVLLVSLTFCLFMGVTAISMGFGALFPSINRISKPFVCPDGDMHSIEQIYRPYPGSTVITRTWYCSDAQTATRTRLGMFPMSLYSGLIYGFGLFVIFYLVMVVFRLKRGGGT